MLRRSLFIFLMAAMLALSLRGDTTVGTRAGSISGPNTSGQISLQRDIAYETIDGKDIKLDVAVPAGPGPYPLILCVHGGAWRVGDKSKFTSLIEDLAHHDYVAASINYRFAPKYKFPAPLDDTKSALLYLKHHAQQYKIDPTKVGGSGESAGSHLLMLMAFSDDANKNDDPLTSTRLGAIANYYGPVDLSRWEVAPLAQFIWQKRFHESMEDAMLDFLGIKTKDDPKVKAASPITFINKNCPPVLTLHGTLDPIVPYRQAELLHEALRKAGVPEKLVPIENGLHGAWAPEAKRKADDQATTFFDRYLKGKAMADQDLKSNTSIRMTQSEK
jgi:acetyl esterase/lipase